MAVTFYRCNFPGGVGYTQSKTTADKIYALSMIIDEGNSPKKEGSPPSDQPDQSKAAEKQAGGDAPSLLFPELYGEDHAVLCASPTSLTPEESKVPRNLQYSVMERSETYNGGSAGVEDAEDLNKHIEDWEKANCEIDITGAPDNYKV